MFWTNTWRYKGLKSKQTFVKFERFQRNLNFKFIDFTFCKYDEIDQFMQDQQSLKKHATKYVLSKQHNDHKNISKATNKQLTKLAVFKCLIFGVL